ncbi:MAG: hypothetical protein CL886_06620 [Dehalococcoidia bacterium]|nr:hypothetical protein [Dehalococcoidia bacterium]|tara:strand:- start:1337 stop:2434 length:1098 start_codon:yes stop_codon:yes gene_type:complete
MSTGYYPNQPPAEYVPSDYDADEHILGLTWLDEWTEEDPNSPIAKLAKAFIEEQAIIAKEKSAKGYSPDLIEEEFLKALSQEQWYDDQTNAWIALQEMRYGMAPLGEYKKLVETTRTYIEETLRDLGFRDSLGNLTVDVTDEFVTDVIYEASIVPMQGAAVSLDDNVASRYIENKFLEKRTLDTEEGSLDIGAGQLQDLYNELNSVARANFVHIPEEDLWDLVIGIKREDFGLNFAYDVITTRVADQFPFLEDSPILRRIMGSELSFDADGAISTQAMSTLQSHLNPYQQRIASLWDTTRNEISMTDLFGDSLEDFIVGEEGEERFMNMKETRDWARLHPNFKSSANYSMPMGDIFRTLAQELGA